MKVGVACCVYLYVWPVCAGGLHARCSAFMFFTNATACSPTSQTDMRLLEEENETLRSRFDAAHIHSKMLATQLSRWQTLYKVCNVG